MLSNIKFSFLTSLLFLVLLGFASCEKDELIPSEPPTVEEEVVMPADSTSTGTTTGTVNCDGVLALVGPSITGGLEAFGFPLADTTFTYLWSTGETTKRISPTATGTYTVTVTNADGCTAEDDREFTYVDPALCIDFTGSITVTGNQISVDVAGGNLDGLTYAWTTDANTATITAGASDVYGVTVRNADGCSFTVSVDYVAPDREEDCNNLTLEVNADGDVLYPRYPTGDFEVVTYEWSNGEQSQNILVTASGTYTLTITTADGCVATASYDYTAPNDGTQEDCNNLTLEVGADGDALFAIYPREDFSIVSYAWSTGEQDEVLWVTASGTYTLTITTAGGCVATASYTYTAPGDGPCDGFSISIDRDNDTLTSVVEGGAGGFAYSWSDGSTNAQLVLPATNREVGYSVTVTDANGCSASSGIEL